MWIHSPPTWYMPLAFAAGEVIGVVVPLLAYLI